ncbi:protein POLAR LOCALIZATION DURING ASYMMETRIC DIVISION AND REDISTRIBUTION [Quillaja saponaria]|uniref:Protein POLAR LOCALIZATION DURING ASYMMETRIC DIVISION AND REDISTRIBUTION n=1 Tax=Quillaja saponaria TaxID=32244 RepID=A0AAD7PS63_QUISA|nr:protein POLAR LOCALIZATION DURING ASYMMETRIC DIVISION AND REDISTRIBUTION [Quillaja saponaria]
MNNLFFKSPNQCVFHNPSNRRISVADILLYEEEEDAGDCVGQLVMDSTGEIRRRRDGSPIIECFSPRRIVARWLSALRQAKEQREKRKKESKGEKKVEEFESGSSPENRSMNELNGSSPSFSNYANEESGHCRNNTTFKLGVGCGLLYLIAASKNELTKMVELWTEMEMLLKNVKKEQEKKDALPMPSGVDDAIACSISVVQVGLDSTSQATVQSHTPRALPEWENMVHDQSIECYTTDQDECMNELEAELKAELEYLQLHLDKESTCKHLQQQGTKVEVRDSNASSYIVGFGEVIDPKEAGNEMCCGVPPMELERTLHELLEARQQERIEELESALESAKQKLLKKEIEASWWRDTARLVFQHVPENSWVASDLDPTTSFELLKGASNCKIA